MSDKNVEDAIKQGQDKIKRAKTNPDIKDPLFRTSDEKKQTCQHFSDAFYELNAGLAIASHDDYYKISHPEADNWALAFYDTLDQYKLLDRVSQTTAPVMLAIITGRIILRDVFHYMEERDKKKMAMYDEDEYMTSPPPIRSVAP